MPRSMEQSIVPWGSNKVALKSVETNNNKMMLICAFPATARASPTPVSIRYTSRDCVRSFSSHLK